jgi:predicted ATPase/transcriptional regulator with XRE-family HTH domain
MDELVSFGEWVQQRRKVLRFTRNQLAQRIGCAAVTIKKIERDERRPSRQIAELLAEHLQIPHQEQARFVRMARGEYITDLTAPEVMVRSRSDQPARASPTTAHNRPALPPQPTSFVGRVDELIALESLLAEPAIRLVILVGPGGIGKTRMALAAAERVMPGFAAGVCFVSLAAIEPTAADDALNPIVAALADALNLTLNSTDTSENQLITHLQNKAMLLVLDNFEHLLSSVPLLSRLLHNAPDIKLLVTSRMRLNLQEEWLFTLTGLTYPAPEATLVNTATALTHYSAVALFEQRVRQHRPDFDLVANAEAVIQICQLVEGMPLALELAAAWVTALPLADIAAEIQHSLDFLASPLTNVPDRHQSIRAVFDASWRLLSNREQALFPQLSIFRDGFTRQAAQAVTGISLQMLNALISKSLLRANQDRDRYDIHELLRQYGAAHLAATNQTDSLRQKHSMYYLTWLADREADLKGAAQLAALNEIEADFENVRVAWLWGAAHHKAAQIGAALQALYLFCTMRNRHRAGLELFKQALAHFRDEPRFAYLYGRLLCRRWSNLVDESIRQYGAGEFSQIEQFLVLARSRGDQAEEAFAMGLLAAKAHAAGDYAKALAISEERLKIYQQLGDRYSQPGILNSIAYWASILGRVKRFREATQQSLALFRAVGNQVGVSRSLILLGSYWLYYEGDLDQATAAYQEAVAIDVETGNHSQRAFSEVFVGWNYLFRGDFEQANEVGQRALETALAANTPLGQGAALSLLGQLNAIQGDYETGLKRASKALELTNNAAVIRFATYGQASNCAGLGDYARARQTLIPSLTQALAIPAPLRPLLWLPLVALILARDDQRPRRAVEVLALLRAHPASDGLAYLDRWPLLTELVVDLKSTLSPATYATAETRGSVLDLLEAGAHLLQELA